MDESVIENKFDFENVKFSEEKVIKTYHDELVASGFSHRKIQKLEFLQYLEKYLWPNYTNDVKCQKEFVLSICAIINEKLTEKVNAWEIINEKPEYFGELLKNALKFSLDPIIIHNNDKIVTDSLEQIVLIQFLNNCCMQFSEFEMLRTELKPIYSIGMWSKLSPSRLNEELNKSPEFRKTYFKVIKQEKKSKSDLELIIFKRRVLPRLVEKFIDIIESVDKEELNKSLLHYLENCLILFINLESMFISRRFLTAIIDDKHLILRAQKLKINNENVDTKSLFDQLIEILDFYLNFEVDDLTGETLTELELDNRHRNRLIKLQKIVYEKFGESLKQMWLSNAASLEESNILNKSLNSLSFDDIRKLAVSINLISENAVNEYSKEDLISLFAYSYKKRPSTHRFLNSLSLYPSEDLIYDENRIPEGYYSLEDNFALPRLSLQYLSFHDYLMRNFELFRLEASYEIKQDLEQCLAHVKPVLNEQDEVVFRGWSRMCMPIDNFQIIEVGKPEIGGIYPRVVRADVTLVLNTTDIVKNEWESLNKFDPCFLISVYPNVDFNHRYTNKELMAKQVGLMFVRGCEIEGMLDKDGKVITEEDRRSKSREIPGQTRTWRVRLDACQYHQDVIDVSSRNKKDVYDSFNLFMRRKPKENNFKAVLETIRDLMNDKFVVPKWLQELLLGYGNPGSAHYTKMTANYIQKQNWVDTFLDYNHLKESFPQYDIKIIGKTEPPFRLIYPNPDKDITFKDNYDKNNPDNIKPILTVESYDYPIKLAQKFTHVGRYQLYPTLPDYPEHIPGNSIPFTSTQIEAIRSGMQQGLTLVVGPPGTGKTDVAVQIINNIYQNYPNQRTLIVTHSNQALNQLFEKIMHLGIDERHLLRLGHGEEALETTKDFSKYGRVNYVLAKRLELLKEVQQLSTCLGCLKLDESNKEIVYTCENSQYFLLSEVMPRWSDFLMKFKPKSDDDDYNDEISYELYCKEYPFIDFFMPKQFQTTPDYYKDLFPCKSRHQDWMIAEACFKHILSIFEQLDDFRSFEILRNGLSRANALLVQHAKIIAMTCTHAALRRRDLIQLGFTYDNILIEESAQILEIETFIPLLLQQPDRSKLNRLKRWVMIGDHNQLPPVIKNPIFQSYCNMSQSMFSRLVKLGVPHVQLDAQGRSRSSLRELYSWRYRNLSDLPTIIFSREYHAANPGLLYEYQLINVPDFMGQGETEPTPHFLQNLAEAEYSVALYMYMLAIGYPADKITILSTYNGQKHLIRDVLDKRCGENIPKPSKVTTVDRFQGQQNDYIILSLVRTKNIGHLRDIRRLVVAMSRARLGLYIFCRVSLFKQCRELRQTFEQLCRRETKLALITGEHYNNLQLYLSDGPDRNNIEIRMMKDSYENDKKINVSFIQDVQHMCTYVNTIFQGFRESLKRKLDVSNYDVDVDNDDEVETKKIKNE